MDAAVVFSDILIVLEAMGARVRFETGNGPVIDEPVVTRAALERLVPVDPESSFDYLAETLRILCRELHPNTAVIGFAGYYVMALLFVVRKQRDRVQRQMEALSEQFASDMLAYLREAVRQPIERFQGAFTRLEERLDRIVIH